MVDLHIYVARHGQDIDNSNGILNGHRDQPLTELGREQARIVAAKMKKAGFHYHPAISNNKVLNAIYSSPLQRAHDTAKIFATELNSISSSDSDTNNNNDDMTVQVLNDLIERDFGIMTGQATSSIVEKCGKDHVLATEHINYFLDPKGAETFPDLIRRAKRLLVRLQEIAEKDVFADSSEDAATTAATKRSILLVTHGDFGKMIYAAYYNLFQWEDVLRQFHFGNSEVLLLSKDSLPEKAHLFETLQFNA